MIITDEIMIKSRKDEETFAEIVKNFEGFLKFTARKYVEMPGS